MSSAELFFESQVQALPNPFLDQELVGNFFQKQEFGDEFQSGQVVPQEVGPRKFAPKAGQYENLVRNPRVTAQMFKFPVISDIGRGKNLSKLRKITFIMVSYLVNELRRRNHKNLTMAMVSSLIKKFVPKFQWQGYEVYDAVRVNLKWFNKNDVKVEVLDRTNAVVDLQNKIRVRQAEACSIKIQSQGEGDCIDFGLESSQTFKEFKKMFLFTIWDLLVDVGLLEIINKEEKKE